MRNNFKSSSLFIRNKVSNLVLKVQYNFLMSTLLKLILTVRAWINGHKKNRMSDAIIK
jgi:hypothetical protein